MSRTVKEWQGKTDDANPTNNCKLRIAKRANYSCEICGRECKWGRGDTDHIKPLWDGGENRETNLQWVCRTPCHSRKTADEAVERAKANKAQKRMAGFTQSKHPVPGSKASKWAKRYDRTTGRFETVKRD